MINASAINIAAIRLFSATPAFMLRAIVDTSTVITAPSDANGWRLGCWETPTCRENKNYYPPRPTLARCDLEEGYCSIQGQFRYPTDGRNAAASRWHRYRTIRHRSDSSSCS